MIIHVVSRGDTIESIAEQYGVSPFQIISDNELDSPDQLVIGQTIVILFRAQTHTVTYGETLSSIALQYGSSTNELYRNNPQLRGLSNLRLGEVLTVSYTQPNSAHFR